jgi:formate dehydrogenase iron-sulfur subunit
VDELRERARKRVEELHRRGVKSAYLYGDAPTAEYSQLHSFYLLVDSPSVYGLPDRPFNPWLHMLGDYARSVATGLVMLVALLILLLTLGH